MTPLEKRAMARTPMTYDTVESFWNGSRSGTAEQCLKALCESHERLRAELEGSEILRADAEKELAAMKAKTVSDEYLRLLHYFDEKNRNLNTKKTMNQIRCDKCGKEFKLSHDDYFSPETLIINSCQSGGIYSIEIQCPYCNHKESVK